MSSPAPSELKSGDWFYEREALWPGQTFGLQVENLLFNERSEFQDVLVFKSKTYGNVLVLDGVIQLTERDEFSYQEMMTHLPIFSHPDPKRVLIIGGGDGGVLREVCRHSGVESITMCELDSMVCEVSKKWFPTVSCSFDDPRVKLIHEDGAKFLSQESGCWDVIIVDSADPDGPAEVLYEASFFKKVANALDKSNGVFCMQGECMWLHLDLIKDVMENLGQEFKCVDYAYTSIPTYPSGQIGMLLAGHNANTPLRNPPRKASFELLKDLRYYNSSMHQASFVLPSFTEREIGAFRRQPRRSSFPVHGMVAALCITTFVAGLAIGLNKR